MPWIVTIYIILTGKIYDLGGQVLAANSAPTIFHLAKETGSELEEMDSHKLALIDSSTGEFKDIKVADDYISVISLTLELQVSVFIVLHIHYFLILQFGNHFLFFC
jgi:hypothetical protein